MGSQLLQRPAYGHYSAAWSPAGDSNPGSPISWMRSGGIVPNKEAVCCHAASGPNPDDLRRGGIKTSRPVEQTDRGGRFQEPFCSGVCAGVNIPTPRDTVLEVYNRQGSLLGFWAYRSGLGVVWMVSIDSPPSEEPGTTLVPWKTGRMVAGTMESMGTNGWQLGPPHWYRQTGCPSQLNNF